MSSGGVQLIYPPDEPINDVLTWEPYSPPSTPLPIYLSGFTNDVGLKTTRVTDYTVQGTGKELRHHYPKDQPWNSDGTLIKLVIGSTTGILDGNDYTYLGTEDLPGTLTWSNLNPKLLYGIHNNSFISYNIDTNSTTTIKTFTGYTSVSYGENEGNMSIDDRYIGLQCEISPTNYDLVVYDNLTDTTYTRNIGNANPNWFSVCQSGQYVVLHYGDNGSGPTQGVKRLPIDLTGSILHLVDWSTHADLGIDANGDDVWVGFTGGGQSQVNNEFMRMVRLSDGLVTELATYTVSSSILYGGFMSCRNTSRPGWVYVTETNGSDRSTMEIVAVKLDSSNTCERFGRHHSESQVYARQAHSCPNRNGTKIFFTSEWNDNYNSTNGYTTDYRPSFVIEVPQ